MAAPSVDQHAVSEAIGAIRRRIRDLAGDREVGLIAVTKGFGPDAIRAAAAAGCTMVGESYAQELRSKFAELTDPANDNDKAGTVAPGVALPAVHFIGQMQTNKVRQIASIVSVWQSVDRPALIDEIAKRAPGATVFVQVNSTGETDKGGCAPQDADALVQQCRSTGLDVVGLMTVGPTSQSTAGTHAAFTLLRSMADDFGLSGCSMGMSADLDIAIEHGATHVRIGSAVFGSRPNPRTRIG